MIAIKIIMVNMMWSWCDAHDKDHHDDHVKDKEKYDADDDDDGDREHEDDDCHVLMEMISVIIMMSWREGSCW